MIWQEIARRIGEKYGVHLVVTASSWNLATTKWAASYSTRSSCESIAGTQWWSDTREDACKVLIENFVRTGKLFGCGDEEHFCGCDKYFETPEELEVILALLGVDIWEK